jgi:Tfp pilus assembly protein PilF
VYILNEIIKYDPSRTVAYLNLADAYHQIDEQNLSKQSYKQYITLMKKQKKDKISKRVYKND